MTLDGLRTCKLCGETSSIDNFYLNRSSGYYSWKCKPCLREYARTKNNKIALRQLANNVKNNPNNQECWSCKKYSLALEYVYWDTRVFINGIYMGIGSEYICKYCWKKIYTKAFRKVRGAIEYGKDHGHKKTGKRAKARKGL
jgi:hypothetical protein